MMTIVCLTRNAPKEPLKQPAHRRTPLHQVTLFQTLCRNHREMQTNAVLDHSVSITKERTMSLRPVLARLRGPTRWTRFCSAPSANDDGMRTQSRLSTGHFTSSFVTISLCCIQIALPPGWRIAPSMTTARRAYRSIRPDLSSEYSSGASTRTSSSQRQCAGCISICGLCV